MFPFHKRKVTTVSMKPPIFGEFSLIYIVYLFIYLFIYEFVSRYIFFLLIEKPTVK